MSIDTHCTYSSQVSASTPPGVGNVVNLNVSKSNKLCN